jgi:hypothetical protein
MSTANISNYGKYLQIIGNTNKNGVKILSYVAFYLLDAIAAEGIMGTPWKTNRQPPMRRLAGNAILRPRRKLFFKVR